MNPLETLLGFGKSITDNAFFKGLSEWAPLLNFGANVAGQFLAHSKAKDSFERSSSAIDAALAQNHAALNERLEQSRAATKETIGQRARQALIERAKMAAIQNESGAEGNTSDRLRAAVMAGAGMDIAMLESDQEAFRRQIQREFLKEDARANSQKSALGSEPSFLTPALGLLGEVAKLGFNYRPVPKSSGLQIYRG